ncbi:hypothetical protein HYY73_01325 [Candidatus Woesearchaeota archaeon]|nr:hypothetical protein [Candidatus Woesearchaeota archaeon]
MKFKHALMVGYGDGDFKPEEWELIDRLCAKRTLLPKDSLEIPRHLQNTDCLLVKLGAAVGKETIELAPNLKYIGMLGTGVGRIDRAYAASKGIAVCNIAGYSTEGVAEFVFAVLLEHVREVERAKKQAREGNYSESSFTGTELKGKPFGIIGLGRIGKRVAEMALKGFGADVRYWSRTRKPGTEQIGARYQEIETLLRECDFLSLHLEFNKQTAGFLNIDRINSIKAGAVFVNLAPMELVDINALVKRLVKGDITFILDHSDELTEEQAKLLSSYKNCIMYPPVAYTTKEATEAKRKMFIDNLANFLSGKPTNKVN